MGRAGGPLQQIFLRFAPEYTAKFGDQIPRPHRRALFDIAACRTEAMGGHKEICYDCEANRFVPHSCRHTLCASCHDAAIDDWLAARANELLPSTYFAVPLRFTAASSGGPSWLKASAHVTFPLPKELREVARSHQSIVLAQVSPFVL